MKKLFTFLSRANNNSVGVSLFNHRRVSSIYSMLTLMAIMLMVPQGVKAKTTTMNFTDATSSFQYYTDKTSFLMSDEDYEAISGAKIGNVIYYRGGDGSLDISRLAFSHNSNANAYTTDGAGFYLYAERISGTWYRGLYTGQHATQLAIRNLKPGDKVTFTYIGSSQINTNWGANLQITNWGNYYLDAAGKGETRTRTLDISFIGDMIIAANVGTIINKIEIESEVAEYSITTTGNETTFEFTKNGTLEQNDFALPYMSFSMGSINDYLVVQGNREVHMYKPTGGEAMDTNGWPNFIPITGSFYEFKPTGGGVVKMEGSLTGVVHLFVFDPKENTWVEKQNGVFHKLNFPDTNNQNPQYGTDYYDENYSFTNNNGYVSFSFTVEKDKYYYVCIDKNNTTEVNNNYAFHMHKMSFTNSFHLAELAKVIDLENVNFTNVNGEDWIDLTAITGYGSAKEISTKRCSGNIYPLPKESYMIRDGFLYMKKPTFVEGTDNAGTVVVDVKTKGGDAVFVATFPYHADYNPAGYTDTNRTYGHTWNFIDPRNSDTNIGNCWINDGYGEFTKGTTTGILSIGQDKNTNSQFHIEVQNREWTYSQRQTGSSGGFHDPYYVNVWDMVGDNADMIWETEGLWFDTGTNLSCIYNESNPVVWYDEKEKDLQVGNPLNFAVPRMVKDDGVSLADPIGVDDKGNPLYADPDRYVGLLPVTDGKKSSFTIPGLKDGDRVLIFMKSGEGSGANGIFLNITGAKDALGKSITTTDLYKAGGTNWQHNRYEGCYHFIKDGDGNMTFDMKAGTMCKLMYIRIYTGQRINTTTIVSQTSDDPSKFLFINDKDAELGSNGSASQLSLRFRGKGQYSTNSVLTYSGNLNANSFTGDNFKVSGTYKHLINFTSKVGEIGMFRLRMTDIEYTSKYVADFNDRNFTVGYRDKVDSYPYTWDFTDIMKTGTLGSEAAMNAEADDYPIAAAAQDEYGDQWDISLFDENGYMKVNTGFDPESCNNIFDAHRIGYGNQLWAGGNVIPEARGLWFYSDDNNPLYNDCMQITSEGIRFASAPLPNVTDEDKNRKANWNYKMVVPDVPQNGAVYLRMKRDNTVKDADNTNGTPFLATKFHFGTTTDANQKTSLSTSGDDVFDATGNSNSKYSFYKVPGTDDEYIVAVLNTGDENHLTFTLNGWIVKKVAVSTDSKTVNVKGWASESRNRVIDHTLTSFLTGQPIKAYTATEFNSSDKTIKLVEITKPMPAALKEGDNAACVLFNTAAKQYQTDTSYNGGEVKVLDNGFHLFVPDMHDYKGDPNNPSGNLSITSGDNGAMTNHGNELESLTGNMMMSFNTGGTENKTLAATSGTGDDIYQNFVLNYKYYKLNQEGVVISNESAPQNEAFYRVAKQGASMKPNSAYIHFLKSSLSNGAKVSFFFGDDLFEEINSGIATGINEASDQETRKMEWYSLDGRKLNGAPTAKGLYIVNGKKVLVK